MIRSNPSLIEKLEQKGLERIAEGRYFLAMGSLLYAHALRPQRKKSTGMLMVYGLNGDGGREPSDAYNLLLRFIKYISGKAKLNGRNPSNRWPKAAAKFRDSWIKLIVVMGAEYYPGSFQHGNQFGHMHWPKKVGVEQMQIIAALAAQIQAEADADPKIVSALTEMHSKFAAGQTGIDLSHLCDKCGGFGFISSYSHVDGGICYDCGGSGLSG